MEATEEVEVFVLKTKQNKQQQTKQNNNNKALQNRLSGGVGISERVLHVSRFIDSLFPKGYTFIRS